MPECLPDSAVSGSCRPSMSIQRALGSSSSGAPLTKRRTLTAAAMHGDEPLTLRLERNLVYPSQSAADSPSRFRHLDQCKLHRIANPLCTRAVVGQFQVVTVVGAFEKSAMRCGEARHLSHRRPSTNRPARRSFAPPFGSASACRSCRCRSPRRTRVSRRWAGDARVCVAAPFAVRPSPSQVSPWEQSFRHVRDDDANREDETDAGRQPDELRR